MSALTSDEVWPRNTNKQSPPPFPPNTELWEVVQKNGAVGKTKVGDIVG